MNPFKEPIPVYQGNELVGTVPTVYPVSKSFLTDVRPGDFVPEIKDGKPLIRANRMLGPGDFENLVGFRKA